MKIEEIPKAELEVMKVIWENKEPVSSKIITTKLEEVKGWKRVTTYTLLNRLTKKEIISTDKYRTYTLYSANISREEYSIYATKLYIKEMFDGNIQELKRILDCIERVSK